ncbi:MAG: DUF3667 domain-containing protein [Pseudomonadota bacterium]
MSDIAEGLGAAIEGSLAAKAVEPNSSATSAGHTDDTHCANCGAPLTGPFCNQCGQRAHVHRTLTAIGHDIIHGVLHLDGKLAHTLPLLALKPGRLTRRYIEGERAKFVSPMAMFLFSVFAMFAVFQMVGLTVPTSFGSELSPEGVVADVATGAIETQAADLKGQIEALEASGSADTDKLEDLQEQYDETQEVLKGVTNGAADAMADADFDFSEDAVITGIKSIDDGLIKKWRENPSLMLYKLQANGYKFGWLLIPISLPFMGLLFLWRRKHKAYDHTVFVTYSLSFMSLFFIALSLAVAAGVSLGWVVLTFMLAVPLHVYKHLKYTYGLSRLSTIWRFFALFLFIFIILILFLNTLLVLGAF